MHTFTFHTDPGHGWLEVSTLEFPTAKQHASSFSYVSGTTVYLEEDCDATAFLNTLTEKYTLETRNVSRGYHWIRDLARGTAAV